MLTGCIFGAFHGSIWRFLPTAILGIAMAYLLAETGNMVYNMLFHAVNNLLPLVLLFGLQWVTEWVYSTDEAATYTQTSAGGQVYSLAALGIYVAGTGVALLLLYAGNYLIHMGRKGYEGKLFGGRRKKHLYILIGVSAGCFVLGCLLVIAAAAAGTIGRMMH